MNLFSIFKNSNIHNPNTLILGEDIFLNDYLAHSYIEDKQFKNLDKIIVDCETDGLAGLINNLTEASLFSSKKMLIIKHPFFLAAKVPQKFQRDIVKLQNIFSNIDKFDGIVVIVASYGKIDKRKKITKIIMNNFNIVQSQVKSYNVVGITKEIIKAEGYTISNSALQLLIKRSDQVIDTIINNYLKLKMIAESNEITQEAILRNIDPSLAQNIFSIMEAALQQKYQEAIERLNDQIHQGTNPVQLLAVFENQIELILVVKILAQRRRSQPQIVKEIGVHPYRVKLALQSNLEIKELKILLQTAIEIEYNYKNGQYHNDNFLELFLLSI